VGHPERRLAEAAKHRCFDVIAPQGASEGASEGACEAATLREALTLALPRPSARGVAIAAA
jgi:hypothetical protein